MGGLYSGGEDSKIKLQLKGLIRYKYFLELYNIKNVLFVTGQNSYGFLAFAQKVCNL